MRTKGIRQMKKHRISFNLLAVVIAICMITTVGVLLFGNTQMLVANAAEIPVVDYDTYTDSDTLLGGTKTIREYASSLHHSTVSWNGVKYTVDDDDPIVQIIPKDLFATKGEYLHIGKEYGFFVKTSADNYMSDTGIKEDKYNNNVDVLVFDITTETDLDTTIDQIIVRVEPLFQYRFAYIDYRSTAFYLYDENPTNAYISIKYSIPSGSTFVVPKPHSTTSTAFGQTWKYFLKDVSVGTTLLNEQELNRTDGGYIASKDDGSFITQFDYKYEGFSNYISIGEVASIGADMVGLFCGALGFLPPPAGGVMGALGLVWSTGQMIIEDIIKDKSDGNNAMGKSVSNGKITAVNKYSTKDAQLANYIDNDGMPCLTKNATCIIKGDDKKGNVWFGQGNNATAYFKISNSSNGTQPWHTRLEREIALTIVEKGAIEHKKAISQYKFLVNDPLFKVTDLDDKTPLTLLADGDNYFQFKPKHTSDYQFAFDQSTAAEVYVKKTSAANFTKATLKDGKYTYRMNANTAYQIKIHGANKSIMNFTISPALTAPSIAANAEYLIKYTPTKTGAYTIAPSNSGFLISKLYQNAGSNDYENITRVDRALNCADADAMLKKDESYYILLKNNTSAAASSSINVTACSATLKDGANASRTFTGGANFKFYKYVMSGTRTDVSFSFAGIDNTSNKVQFCTFNMDGDAIIPIIAYHEGYMKLGQLTAGTYYIGIKTTSTVALTPTVTKGGVSGIWKQYQDGNWVELDTNPVLHLPRNNTYKFGFWLGTTMVMNYNIEDALVQKNLYFPTEDNSIIIEEKRGDSTQFTLKAVKQSDDENYNGLEYPNGLIIFPEFSESEIKAPSINYINKIRINMTLPNDVTYIECRVDGNSGGGTGIACAASKNIASNLITDFDCLKELCNLRATKAKFIIYRIRIKSGSNGGMRDILLDKKYDINCYSNYPSNNCWYMSNELHLFNARYEQAHNRKFNNDIELVTMANWAPIPVVDKDMVIDGNNFSIRNTMKIHVSKGTANHGFVAVNNGTIQNLNILSCEMIDSYSVPDEGSNFGTIAGINNGYISFCKAAGDISVNRRIGVVGGIAGINNATGYIHNSDFGYKLSGSGSSLINSGDVGGIAGRNIGGDIYLCTAQDLVVGCYINKCAKSFGGIVGFADGGIIELCSVGSITIKVTNTTLVSGYYPSMGWIVGHIKGGALMKNCTVLNHNQSITNLTIGYRKYCFKGPNGSYGWLENSTVEGCSSVGDDIVYESYDVEDDIFEYDDGTVDI